MQQSTPLLRHIADLITPDYAAKWKIIGLLLHLSKSELAIIEHDYGHSAVRCCNQMWEFWLNKCTSAKWKDILNVLKHKSVTETEEGTVKKSS